MAMTITLTMTTIMASMVTTMVTAMMMIVVTMVTDSVDGCKDDQDRAVHDSSKNDGGGDVLMLA